MASGDVVRIDGDVIFLGAALAYLAICLVALIIWIGKIQRVSHARRLAPALLASIGGCSRAEADNESIGDLLSRLDQLVRDHPGNIAALNRLAMALAAAHLIRSRANITPSASEVASRMRPAELDQIENSKSEITSVSAIEAYINPSNGVNEREIKKLSSELAPNLSEVIRPMRTARVLEPVE